LQDNKSEHDNAASAHFSVQAIQRSAGSGLPDAIFFNEGACFPLCEMRKDCITFKNKESAMVLQQHQESDHIYPTYP